MRIPAIWKKTVLILAAVCMILSLGACGSKKDNHVNSGREAYQEYVISIMDANYLGKYDKYMELTGSDEEQAKNIYDANIQNYALELAESLSIKQDVVSQAVTDRLLEISKSVYSQTKYEAVDVIRDGDTYTVTVEIQPVDFFATMQKPFQDAVDEFNRRAKDGEFDKYTDTEYEEAYAQAVTEAVGNQVTSIAYGTKIKVDVTLDYDKETNVYVITDEQMEALDDKVVNMAR